MLILSWALLQDKQFLQHGVSVRVHGLKDVTKQTRSLRPATAVGGAVGKSAGEGRGSVLFGLQVPPLASAANLAVLGQGVRGEARDGPRHAPGCRTRWRPTRRRWVWPRITASRDCAVRGRSRLATSTTMTT